MTAAPQPHHPGYARAIVLTVLCFGLLLVSLETGMRVAFDRFSHIGARIAYEYSHARSLRPANEAPNVLFVGNSLLLEALDVPGLQQRVPEARVSRLVIENTGWIDWYYGIRRLLAEGSRPKAIVLCLNTAQLAGSGIRGEFSSYYLFQARDIPAIAREAHYDLTRASGLVLAHYSRFYADRNNLRSFLLNRVDSTYVDLMFRLTMQPAGVPTHTEIERIVESRLAALKAVGDASGVQCILLIPAGFSSGSAEKDVHDAGTRAGVEVWEPIPQNVLPRSDYKDGFHLNQHGSALFTEALAGPVKKLLYK